MCLEIFQNSQENTCARGCFSIKKRLWHRCFHMNFAKFLRISFLQDTSGRLLLMIKSIQSGSFWLSYRLVGQKNSCLKSAMLALESWGALICKCLKNAKLVHPATQVWSQSSSINWQFKKWFRNYIWEDFARILLMSVKLKDYILHKNARFWKACHDVIKFWDHVIGKKMTRYFCCAFY